MAAGNIGHSDEAAALQDKVCLQREKKEKRFHSHMVEFELEASLPHLLYMMQSMHPDLATIPEEGKMVFNLMRTIRW